MKKYLSLIAFTMMAVVSLSLTGCGKLSQQGQSQNAPQKPSYKKFVGTYKFDYTKKDGSLWNCPPIVVLEDGRCIIVYGTVGGGKAPEYLGDANPISETAFTLSGDYKTFIVEVELYNQSGHWGNTTYQYNWKTRDVVFDVAEGRLYRNKGEYRNRDIEEAVYTTMTHNNSTSY